MHYARWWRSGDPGTAAPARVYGSAIERFENFVDRRPDGCWLWTAAISDTGYGSIWNGDRIVNVHKWAYEHFVGPVAEGLQLDHLCRVRHCCNPEHLEPVTPRENSLRSESLNAQNARKTHCIRGHEFTPENTIRRVDRPNVRGCRECKRLRDRQR